jgi:GNAT superfamily N-acetyltransferase
MYDVHIEKVAEFDPLALAPLVKESTAEGFELVRRLLTEWDGGANRFARPGEALFFAVANEVPVGVCGLNIDPHANDPRIGRVRHLYVAASHRRTGIGRALVGRIVTEAAKSFDTLTLRTTSAAAAAFYVALGFTETTRFACSTHCLRL